MGCSGAGKRSSETLNSKGSALAAEVVKNWGAKPGSVIQVAGNNAFPSFLPACAACFPRFGTNGKITRRNASVITTLVSVSSRTHAAAQQRHHRLWKNAREVSGRAEAHARRKPRVFAFGSALIKLARPGSAADEA